MTTCRPRVPWLIVAFFGLLGLFGVACFAPCHDYQTQLKVWTEEYLVVDEAPSDSAGGKPVLRAELWRDETYDVQFDESSLVYVDGEGLRLPDGLYLDGNANSETDDIHLEDFTLSFALIRQGTEGQWDDAFPPIEMQGGASEADLWTGWTMLLDWSDLGQVCK